MSKDFKLSKRTISILENFSKINLGILFRPGNFLYTKSTGDDIFAVAKITEEIPARFAIADLSKFMGVISLYDDPTLSVTDKTVTVKSANSRKFTYTLSAEKVIVFPPDDELELNFPEPLATFELNGSELIGLKKNRAIVGLPQIAITAEKGDLLVKAVNPADETDHVYSSVLGKSDKHFNLYFVENKITNLMDYNYSVSVVEGMVRFQTEDLTYYIAPELGSSYR